MILNKKKAYASLWLLFANAPTLSVDLGRCFEIHQHTQQSTYQPIQVRNKIKSNICIEAYVALSQNIKS
jgi:hypothetical protein